jgi:hypothetical protein
MKSIYLLFLLCIVFAGCDFGMINNPASALQIQNGGFGSGRLSFTINGRNYSSGGIYYEKERVLIAKADTNNFLEIHFAPGSGRPPNGEYTLRDVAVQNMQASIIVKNMASDGSGWYSSGANTSGFLTITSTSSGKMQGSFRFTAAGAILGNGQITLLQVFSGTITDIPIQ